MSKEVEDPLNPPAGGGVSGEEVSAICSPFYRYQQSILPLSAVRQTAGGGSARVKISSISAI